MYVMYLNVRKFLEHKEYRNHKILSEIEKPDNLHQMVQLDEYIKIMSVKDKKRYATLILADSSTFSGWKGILSILVNTFKTCDEIFLITKKHFLARIKKKLVMFKSVGKIHNFIYDNFTSEVTKGPCVSKHTVLTPEQAITVCRDILRCHPMSLEKISVSEPQCIWIGAKVGDIVKINGISSNEGKYTDYRLVFPESKIKTVSSSAKENYDAKEEEGQESGDEYDEEAGEEEEEEEEEEESEEEHKGDKKKGKAQKSDKKKGKSAVESEESDFGSDVASEDDVESEEEVGSEEEE
jgi:DNA-directed RNA polymerase subunit H (RpoH/RPB5)